MELCVECDIHLTRRDDKVCYRCNEKRESDKLLATLAPVSPVNFPLEPGVRLPCEGKTELFFTQGKVRVEAKELCAICPVTAWCLSWAIENDEDGVWGGMSRAERDRHAAKLTKATVTLVA